MTASVAHYDALMAYRPRTMWVPLTNVTPNGFRAVHAAGDRRWEESAGHPYLSALGPGAEPDQAFASRHLHLLETNPTSAKILRIIREMPRELRPWQRYEHLAALGHHQLKRSLDWLVCAGMVTRMFDGDRPGVLPVPLRPTDQPW